MNARVTFAVALTVFLAVFLQGCTSVPTTAKTEIITIYDNHAIPASTGISTATYTKVDGYRYVNVMVEFEQKTAGERPVSLGVIFAHSANGKLGSRRYFNFEDNFTSPADPQMITLSGKNSWHGHPHDKSSYIVRIPANSISAGSRVAVVNGRRRTG